MINLLVTTEMHNSAGFAGLVSRRGGRRLVPAILSAGLALVVSGCALSLSEFARNPEQSPTDPVVLSGSSEFDTTTTAPPTAEGLAAQAAAVAGSPTALAPTAATTQNPAQPAGYPNINAVPEEPKSKLLTPEEKARVIAELEALARGQGTSAPAAEATSSECDSDAAQELDPADRLNGDPAGAAC